MGGSYSYPGSFVTIVTDETLNQSYSNLINGGYYYE
jgi:hypothetical protein